MGCASRLIFSWGGNPGVGSLHRFRDAVEHGLAGAARDRGALPRRHGRRLRGRRGQPAVRRAARLRRHRPAGPHAVGRRGSSARSPASGWPRSARCGPTSASSTPSRPTAPETCSCGGSAASRRRPCSRRARSIVTVEEVVDELDPRARRGRHPGWVVTAVAAAPGGAHPSYAHGYYDRDNGFYRRWDAISRDRDRFRAWMSAARARDGRRRGVPREPRGGGHRREPGTATQRQR